MKRQEKSKFVKIMCIVLAFVMILSCFAPLMTYAAEGEEDENNFVITGEYTGGFDLKVSDENLFETSNIAPGDVYSGKITVKNTGPDKMEIAILNIVNNIEDTTLYEELELKISHDGTTLYNGKYSNTPEPVTEYLGIDPRDKIVLDIEVVFPQQSGNKFQGKKLDANWIFEANYYNKERVQTGHELNDENPLSEYFPTILLTSSLLLGIAIMLIIIAKKKEKDENKNL